MTAGVYELGSVMKTFNTAMALDSGEVSITDSFDASRPLRVSRYTISDFHGKNRVLTVPEVFIYSSNIGSARMALEVGVEGQQDFFHRIGMGGRISTELPETALPLLPARWTEISAMTIAFGHGLSITPMHAAVGAAALMNGGMLIPPTFLPRTEAEAMEVATRVVAPETSDMMRYLFRLNVERGSGRNAEVAGYYVVATPPPSASIRFSPPSRWTTRDMSFWSSSTSRSRSGQAWGRPPHRTPRPRFLPSSGARRPSSESPRSRSGRARAPYL
jgi:cell division protein FtsI (penicillin-binding protein 3)